MRTRAIVSILVCFVCLGVLLVLYLERADVGLTDETKRQTERGGESLSRSEMPSETAQQPTPKKESKNLPSSPLFLGDECPEPLSREVLLDAECLTAINRHFRSKPAYTIEYFGMSPMESTFTYGEMFDGHVRDRELVVEALLRPECRLLEGPIRLDLRESCNAEAFGRYALLTELCHTASKGGRWFEPWLESSKSPYLNKMDEIGDFASNSDKWQGSADAYHTQVSELREEVLRDVWLGSACPSHDSTDRLIYSQENPSYEELATWWNREAIDVRENQLAKYNLPQRVRERLAWAPYERLAEIAVRLGDARLIFDDSLISLLSGTNDYRNSKRSLFLWMQQLDRAVSVRESSRIESISLAARGLAGLRESGFDPDVAEVARFLCETVDSQEEVVVIKDCVSAFRDAESLLDTADWKALRMLDEIVSEALDQGFYQ